jgi:hypothetical protein
MDKNRKGPNEDRLKLLGQWKKGKANLISSVDSLHRVSKLKGGISNNIIIHFQGI